MTHLSVSKLCHHCFSYWLVTWSAVSRYLNQYWIIVNWSFRNKFQWHFNRNSYIFLHENAFENVVWKMAAILSPPQCVNMHILTSMIADQILRQLTIFASLTSIDMRIGLSLQISFMSRIHHSIVFIIYFTYVTIPYITNACFHIKLKSSNAVCFHLVKNGLWRCINQRRQQISNTLPCHDKDEIIDEYHKGVYEHLL